ncbi:hypothetical protein G4D82_13040 [Flavobacterium sp. CYK-4]|uniref:hypothetical protein n=1 Tax=Flavobacterium lotistagni TaxID=2709660 RepID=UPI001408B63C|nr:hypothetical protein [Flavobacterium lotistagni]NHM08151.1 hypothetical protein [Flavobacterium lotistagni]
MGIFKRLFDFYLQSSMHVALSVLALIQITGFVLDLPSDWAMSGFGYFGTIVGYNFVKYDALARIGKPPLSLNLKLFILVSAVSFLAAAYCFLKLQPITQIISVVCVLITALYTLPFFPNHKSARSWAGLKIYIVALCWVGVTVVLPVINAGAALTTDFYIVCVKRFLLIVVLLFIFEIIDLAWDDPHLKTVPQQIGVVNTKKLGVLLLVIFLMLELLQVGKSGPHFMASIMLIGLTTAFLLFAHQRRSRYYTMFWAESIPMVWWLVLVLMDCFY